MVVLPDWNDKTLGELFDFFGGLSASRAQLSTNGIPYLHYGDIHGSTGVYVDVCADNTIPRLNMLICKVSSNSLLQDGDVVFVDASEDGKGTSKYVVVRNKQNKPFISGLHTIIAKAKTDELDNLFKEYCFQTEAVKSQFKLYAVGTKVMGINKTSIERIAVIFPKDKHEQRAIAETLSNMDGYIVSLEKLISKKKAIKQGTMQELLTGKRRLPGFNEEWVMLNLADKSILKARIGWQGLTTAEYKSEGYAYLVTGTDFVNGHIHWSECHYVEKYRYDQDANIKIQNGDILITKDGTIGKVAFVDGLKKPTTLNSGVFVIRPLNEAYDNMYAYFVLTSTIFTDFLTKLSAGSTINHLYQKDFVDFEFLAPSEKEEQHAISSTLFDMDSEIESLTTKLEKSKLIKQGMMQELLTGRIRLLKSESNIATLPITVEPVTPVVAKVQEPTSTQKDRHNQHFDDAVMIAGIVDAFYSDQYRLGRKKVQKLLYLLRRHQDASTEAFKKKAAGPYADEIRYKGGEPIAIKSQYIDVTTTKGKGSTFAKGRNVTRAIDYINRWDKQQDIAWLLDKFKYTSVDDLELLATVDMAICDLEEEGTAVSVASIKHLIATNKEWKAKLKKKVFADSKIAKAINDLQALL